MFNFDPNISYGIYQGQNIENEKPLISQKDQMVIICERFIIALVVARDFLSFNHKNDPCNASQGSFWELRHKQLFDLLMLRLVRLERKSRSKYIALRFVRCAYENECESSFSSYGLYIQ